MEVCRREREGRRSGAGNSRIQNLYRKGLGISAGGDRVS
ncbi:hypothetical protein MUK42_33385 [Musa troglodytarum]|uniref:Uncharacterized protein n=1 Tax=Musa troglodytarum TaxID=320322 RepID=A0A9E7HAC4_9LILI|nr:hypothetical protein MUK42_33385 [Musa troglodytarum]